MNNKVTLLSAGVAALSATFFIANAPSLMQQKPSHRIESSRHEAEEEGSAGAGEWLYRMRANRVTGVVNPADVYKALQDAEIINAAAAKTNTLTLNWKELGPDNVGGRTRALLFDKNDPTHMKMFAGSVSGGLWVTTTGGTSWKLVNDTLQNLAVTCITQAANGDIYFGTGEGLYLLTGQGSGGLLGQGIWKSTDDGQTFTHLASTSPSSPNNTSDTWAIVNKLAADPVRPNRIYAAMARGFRLSDDGGMTWKNPKLNGSNLSLPLAMGTDVDVASDGSLILSIDANPSSGVVAAYKSATGDDGDYFKVSTGANGLPANGTSRMEFAIAPSDPNTIYCSAAKFPDNSLQGIYMSDNKAGSWTLIGPGGSSSVSGFQPLSNSVQGQGEYDNAIAVDPANSGRILVGGVELWSWTLSQGWIQIGSEQDYPGNYFYVHADKHIILFHPSNKDICYIGCDGGVFRSVNASQAYPHWAPVNHGYNVMQCYSVAFASYGNNVMAGMQDNGTQYIDGSGNTSMSASHILSGDGGYSEISMFNPNALFAGNPYGEIKRSSNNGNTFNDYYNILIDKFDLSGASSPDGAPDEGASFVTPFVLWENGNDPLSADTVTFINSPAQEIVSKGDGIKTQFTGTLNFSQQGTIAPGTVKITAGSQTVTDNGSGSLTGNTGTGANTISYVSGTYDVTFALPPSSITFIEIQYSLVIPSGSVLKVKSVNNNNRLFPHTSPVTLAPGDSLRVQELVQSKLAVGLAKSVWLTKNALNFANTPNWVRICDAPGMVSCLAFTSDGDNLFAGTESGKVYRISNLSSISDTLGKMAGLNDTNRTYFDLTKGSVVIDTLIFSAPSGQQGITGIGVDPGDPNHVIVTLGNYSNNVYVYRSTNALSASPVFTSRQGNLPKMPVYKAVIDKYNGSRVFIATEIGVFGTENITAAAPSWVAPGNMPKVATFMLRQQTNDPWNCDNSGSLFIGTHGRGMFRSDDYMVPLGTGPRAESAKKYSAAGITVFPNPSISGASVSFRLDRPSDLKLYVFNLRGELVKEVNLPSQSAGDKQVKIADEEIPSGTYIVKVSGGGISASAKFVLLK